MDGRLGHGDTGNRDNPTLNEGLEAAGVAVIAIAAGTSHCLASDAEGSVWSWGCGASAILHGLASPWPWHRAIMRAAGILLDSLAAVALA